MVVPSVLDAVHVKVVPAILLSSRSVSLICVQVPPENWTCISFVTCRNEPPSSHCDHVRNVQTGAREMKWGYSDQHINLVAA